MTGLLNLGLTSSHLMKISATMTFQDLYGLSKSGFEQFQGELLKLLPIFSDKLLKSTFQFLVGRPYVG